MVERIHTMKEQVQRLVQRVPFQPFEMRLENGEQVVVEHPENISFTPIVKGKSGSRWFFVVLDEYNTFSTFDTITSLTVLDKRFSDIE